MKNIIFLGSPASGKGTQSQVISESLDLPKLSTGDMLRKLIEQGSEEGNRLNAIMKSGGFVPDEDVIHMISDCLRSDMCANGFVLDGFPRNIYQAKILDQILSDLGRKVAIVINLQVGTEVIVERISGRFSCKQCGAGYHKIYLPTSVPGVCDVCGSTEFVIRSDDNEQAILKRIKEYNEQTAPLISYYLQDGVLVSIDGEQSIDSVTQNITYACSKV